MSIPKHSDKVFIETWHKYKSATKVARELDMSVRNTQTRRKKLEERLKINLDSDSIQPQAKTGRAAQTPGNMRREINLKDGMVVVFSDAHFWPDDPSPAYRTLLKFLELHKQKIKVVVNNGDAFDGASISRFPAQSWDKLPTVKEELEACVEALTEIESRVVKQTPLIWCLGNHDARYESLIINNAPQLAGIKGTSLTDWFPLWKPCYSFWVNEDTVIKHRFKGGAMAGRNNTIHGGCHIVTGHTHVGCVNPFHDYNGTRYGVQTGTLANIHSRQFTYTEDNPKDWMECFAVLTYKDGKLLMPELVKVWDEDHYEFRGEVVKI